MCSGRGGRKNGGIADHFYVLIVFIQTCCAKILILDPKMKSIISAAGGKYHHRAGVRMGIPKWAVVTPGITVRVQRCGARPSRAKAERHRPCHRQDCLCYARPTHGDRASQAGLPVSRFRPRRRERFTRFRRKKRTPGAALAAPGGGGHGRGGRCHSMMMFW